jgi:hypothetical protein
MGESDKKHYFLSSSFKMRNKNFTDKIYKASFLPSADFWQKGSVKLRI